MRGRGVRQERHLPGSRPAYDDARSRPRSTCGARGVGHRNPRSIAELFTLLDAGDRHLAVVNIALPNDASVRATHEPSDSSRGGTAASRSAASSTQWHDVRGHAATLRRSGDGAGSSTTRSSSRTARTIDLVSIGVVSESTARGSSTPCPPSSIRAEGDPLGPYPCARATALAQLLRCTGRAPRSASGLLDFLTADPGRGRALGLVRLVRPRGALPALGETCARCPARCPASRAICASGGRTSANRGCHRNLPDAHDALGRRPAQPRPVAGDPAALATAGLTLSGDDGGFRSVR